MFLVDEVFAEGLQGIGLPIHQTVLGGEHIAFEQVGKFFTGDVVTVFSRQYASLAYLVEHVDVLRHVAAQGHVVKKIVGIYVHEIADMIEGIYRLLLEPYIIIIGGTDDGKLCLGIQQAFT